LQRDVFSSRTCSQEHAEHGERQKETTGVLSLKRNTVLASIYVEGKALDVAVWEGGKWAGEATSSGSMEFPFTRNAEFEAGRCRDSLL